MKYFIYTLAIILLLGVNLGLFNNLQIRGQIPNLLFLFVLCVALEKKDLDFLLIALVSGLFLDFYSAGFFGGFAFIFLGLSFLGYFFVNYLVVLEMNWKTLSAALLVGLLLFNLFLWLYGLIAFKLNWTGQYVSFKIFLRAFPASFIYNCLLLYPMYLFVNWLRRFVDNLTIRRRGFVP